jgi:hypothetical protein
MKKRIFAGLTAVLMLLALTACGGNPDGKELLKKAAANTDPVTYSTMKMDISIEDLTGTGLGMAMRMEGEGTEEVMILDCDFDMLGSSVKDTLYMDTSATTPQVYFEGTDGAWYSIEGDMEDSFSSLTSLSSMSNSQALAIFPALCSEIKTVGKENLNGRSVYKIQLVLDSSKLLESSLGGIDMDDLDQEDLNEAKEAMQQVMDMIKIHIYVEADTSRFAGMNISLDMEAYKAFMVAQGASEESLKMLDGMSFSIDASTHYDEKEISLPAGTASATPLTDEEEIMEKMPLMQGLMSILSMVNNLGGM